jgi:CTP:molybdopterin cytidylyltransferase MocA
MAALTKNELNELFVLLRMARRIAQIYGLGYGDQPACWPKHEQRVFAEAMADGRYDAAMAATKRAHPGAPDV